MYLLILCPTWSPNTNHRNNPSSFCLTEKRSNRCQKQSPQCKCREDALLFVCVRVCVKSAFHVNMRW